jgi:hypothetical protein
MSVWKLVLPGLILVLGSARVLAVTGNVTVHAGCLGPPGGYFVCGYSDSALGGSSLGSATNLTLSDGKVVSQFEDVHGIVTLRIGGFTSDPGKSYFTSINVTCFSPPTTMNSSTSTYTYAASTGYAVWGWARSTECMSRPWMYTLGINWPTVGFAATAAARVKSPRPGHKSKPEEGSPWAWITMIIELGWLSRISAEIYYNPRAFARKQNVQRQKSMTDMGWVSLIVQVSWALASTVEVRDVGI